MTPDREQIRRKKGLREVDPLLHAFLVVMFAVIAACALYAVIVNV